MAGANQNVDAIVSGHTHLAYNHKVPVQAWINQNRPVTSRPVVSAGQYGANLNRLQFEFEPGADGDLVNIRQTVLQLKDYAADPATQAIVDDAVAFAETQGNVVLGEIEHELRRARRVGDDGQVVENRGGESTLGNLIAEVQRWKTDADIGFMNPGGLRADLLGLDGTPRDVTYRQAANTQPFANTLVTMDLTGAQIKTVLEQQWQRDADNNIPSRPFLRLGTSAGFTSTFDATKPEGSRITGMWLDGSPIVPTQTYRVSATSFLAGAGDNFFELANGTNVQDTGKTDLEAVVDYLHELAPNDAGTPLPVEYAQHQVGITFPGGAPAVYEEGDTLEFSVSSLAMTGADDLQDSQVQLLLGATPLGTFAVDNTFDAGLLDNFGKAQVSVTLPAVNDGTTVFTLVGTTTGTEVTVPVPTSDGLVDSTVSGVDQTIHFGDAGSVPVTVTPADATGTVTLEHGPNLIGTLTLDGLTGEGDISVPAGSLPLGTHVLTLDYSGDAINGSASGTVTVTVVKATPSIDATPTPATVLVNGATSSVAVTVTSPPVGDASGTVTASVNGTIVDTETLSAGAATLTVGPFSTVGEKTVTVAYSGDTSTASGSTSTTVTVVKKPVPTTTTASAASMVFGTPGSVTASVSPAGATGTITVRRGLTLLGTATLSGGTAQIDIPGTALQPGNHRITVYYSGDATHLKSSTAVNVVVAKAPSTTSAVANPTTVKVRTGKSNVTVTVSSTVATAQGRVQALVNGRVVASGGLSSGQVTLSVGRFSSLGVQSVVIRYLGNTMLAASQSTVTLTVVP